MRTLLILITLAVIVMIVKRLWLQPRPPARKTETGGRMVQCANCGMFIPQDEAFERDGHYYCSREHRDASRQ